MTEEIKRILDEMLWQFEKYPTDDFIVKNKESRILLNYITNLQKENEELLKKLEDVSLDEANIRADILLEQQDYKQRNEKAVEYIKENTDKLKTTRIPKIDFNYNELLNILKGGDE